MTKQIQLLIIELIIFLKLVELTNIYVLSLKNKLCKSRLLELKEWSMLLNKSMMPSHISVFHVDLNLHLLWLILYPIRNYLRSFFFYFIFLFTLFYLIWFDLYWLSFFLFKFFIYICLIFFLFICFFFFFYKLWLINFYLYNNIYYFKLNS